MLELGGSVLGFSEASSSSASKGESVADTAVIPMWDYLCLGADARVNRPSTTGNNWRWRMRRDAASADLAARIRRLTQVSGRLPEKAVQKS